MERTAPTGDLPTARPDTSGHGVLSRPDTSGSALVTQQLAEFLAVVSACPDAPSATRAAVQRAARALEAEVAAVVGEYGLVAAVGFPADRAPVGALAEVAAGKRAELQVPGAGTCSAVAAPIGGDEPQSLVVARSGDDGFTVDEVSLVRGMARVLELTVEKLRTLDAERRQAVENAHLIASLQERQRLMEQLSAIQRTIARRAPLDQILDAIITGAQELLSAEAVGLRLRDSDHPGMLLLVSSCGLPDEVAKRMWRMPVEEAGVAGQAVLQDNLVVADGYPGYQHVNPELVAAGMHAAMAAPVHDNGVVVGSLVVGSFSPDRSFSKHDQAVLLAFAEHVSLAVTDANTLEAMHQAFHDSLTGLASRALFIDRVEHGLAVAAREHGQVAVLFADLDRFKIVNDSLGHASGDQLLAGVAERLRDCIRASDSAARLGGDEFAVLLHDVRLPDQASVVAARVVAALSEPFEISGREIFIGCSVGIAFSELGQRDAESLIQRADLAMYQAKRNGKGRYETFEPAMAASLRKSLDMEPDLRRAVAQGEFVLHYQPIVDLQTARVCGLEALVRWRHPVRGLVPPLDFIPLAEETGLILPIGRWVLEEACRQASRWNAARPGQPALTLNVNLSARQLQQPDLPDMVAGILRDTRLDPSCLVLEITESMLVSDTDATAQQMRDLKTIGIRLAVDDFGTGYSSLAYLERLPVDILKIDKSFVDRLGQGSRGAALTRAIVQLGHTLKMATVGEGIEMAEQYGELFDAGCELGQGFYFARPMAEAEVDALVLPGGTALPTLPEPAPPVASAILPAAVPVRR